MPKMKLPDGWTWIKHSHAQNEFGDNVFTDCDGLNIDDEQSGIAITNPEVALAVLRPTDPVYLAANALFMPDGCVSVEKARELRQLLESLEEPG